MYDTDRDRERAVELRQELRDYVTQVGAEGWIYVVRDGSTELEARPVDRQDDREEGERIESDEWLIREQTGETYTVSEETFESEFDESGTYHQRLFRIDLSWDDIDANDETVPTIAGATCYAYVDARIHVPTDSIVSMDVVRVEYEHERAETAETYDSIPIEVLYDSDLVADVESEER